MSELSELQSLLQPGSDGAAIGTVESRLDGARLVVLLANGVRRQIFGQAPVGALVRIEGQQLVSRLGRVRSAVTTIE